MLGISPDYVIRSGPNCGKTLIGVLTSNFSVDENGCFNWSGYRNNAGYGVIRLEGSLHRVTRLVCEYVHGKVPLKGEDVRHKCDNPSCVNPEHLLVGSRLDNVRDMIERGRNLVGTKCPWAKLTKEQADSIRQRRASGERSVDLAKEFGVHPNTIYTVFAGKGYV